MNFTTEQQQAIDVYGRSILVSAAAGSGKTAVLTQRVIKKLTDPKNPIMADTLVIVTYTVAAAAELKERIYSALLEKINNDPLNKLLSSQLLLLEKAKISTIHSLCSSLIKENYHTLGLSSNYRMLDENELSIIISQTIEDYFEDQYQDNNMTFLSLVNFFCQDQDTPLMELVQKIYTYIRSFAIPFAWLDIQLNKLNNINSITDYIYYDKFRSILLSKLHTAILKYHEGLLLIGDDEPLVKAYKFGFNSDLEVLETAQSMLQQGDYERFYIILSTFSPARLLPVRKYDDKEHLELIKAKREVAKKIIQQISTQYLFTNDEFITQSHTLYKQTKTLFDIVKTIYKGIDRQKLDKNVLDYSDLEHYTLKLLTTELPDGTLVKSDFAKGLCTSFNEIMVDECQDINDVQNTIFNMLSNEQNNIFMVGDVKQSIYRFRKAMPQIFIDKRKSQPIYSPVSKILDSTSPISILLKENFRSRKDVTDCVNHLFGQIMCEQVGEITYNDEEQLIPSAQYPPNERAVAQLHIVSQEYLGEQDDFDNDEINENFEDKDTGRTAVDAHYIASLIQNMVVTKYQVTDKQTGLLRPCSYSDFGILLRSTKGKSEIYIKALNKFGIDAFCNTTAGYFNTNEVGLLLSLLKVIDNPLKDYDMLCVMLSPIFMYSPDEVVDVRLVDKDASLYTNLLKLDENGDLKATQTIDLIRKFRQDISISSVDKLIESIYETTDIIAIMEATNFGIQKGTNLMLLLDYARIYEESSGGGLVGFLRYIDRCIEQNKDFESANTISQSADVVKIVTIHSTKGLEYPICILADCSKKFNLMDLNNRYQLNSEYGFAMNYTYRDHRTNLDIKTIHSNIIKEKARLETISEEQRLLYVAMTRAREKLIMVVTTKYGQKLIERWERTISSLNAPHLTALPVDILSKATSYADWLLPAFLRATQLYQIDLVIANPTLNTAPDEGLIDNVLPDENIVLQLEGLFSKEYAFSPLVDIVAKSTVTTLAKSQNLRLEPTQPAPKFMLEQNDNASPTQKGTALHEFMQFANIFSDNFNINLELVRLVDNQFISPHQATLIDLNKIDIFLSSNIYQRMKSANQLFKEYSFIYEIPIKDIYDDLDNTYDNERLVIQGIADCVFIENDKIIIVDYKTDRTNSSDELIERYYNQMKYYKQAMERVFNLPVNQCILYSLHMGREIIVNC